MYEEWIRLTAIEDNFWLLRDCIQAVEIKNWKKKIKQGTWTFGFWESNSGHLDVWTVLKRSEDSEDL